MTDNPKVRHAKRLAKQIKKKYPHVPLMTVQHDLAQHFEFKSWGELIKASPEEIQKRIDRNPLD